MNFIGHKDYVLSVAVSHDGKWVVSGSKDRGVQFWDANTAVAQCMLQGHKNSGESVVLGSVGYTVRSLEVTAGCHLGFEIQLRARSSWGVWSVASIGRIAWLGLLITDVVPVMSLL